VKWFTIANFGVAAAARPITSQQRAAQSHSPGPICRCILNTHLNKVARQLNEQPRKTLAFETQPRDLTPVLRRPVEPAAKCGHSRMLKHIAEFFALEKDIRGRSAEERRLIRQQRGRPLADAFQKWLRTKRGLISQKGKLADAIR
jgi:transposase IS66 family protein